MHFFYNIHSMNIEFRNKVFCFVTVLNASWSFFFWQLNQTHPVFFWGLDVLKVIGVVDDPALCVIPYEGETDF